MKVWLKVGVIIFYVLGYCFLRKRMRRDIVSKRLNFRHGYKNPRPHFCNRSTLIIHI